MYKYLRLLFIFLVPLLIMTCTNDSNADPTAGCTDLLACNYDADAVVEDDSCSYPEANYDCAGNCIAEVDECDECAGDGSSCATTFTLALNGSSSEFLDDSGAVDQDSDAAKDFKAGIAGQVGANEDQIVITDIEPTRGSFSISFIFVESEDTLTVIVTVDECVDGLIDAIVAAVASGTDLTIAGYTVTTDDIIIENIDDCPLPLIFDECNVCGGSGLNDAGCCGDDVPSGRKETARLQYRGFGAVCTAGTCHYPFRN